MWARYGFTPTANSWRPVADQCIFRAESLKRSGKITQQDVSTVKALAGLTPGPRIRLMADLRKPMEDPGDGHGSMMMVLGGPVQGGKIYGEWPGLEKEQLYEGRDLAVTTDFRAVLSELVRGHLGQSDLSAVFPGFRMGTPLGLLRS